MATKLEKCARQVNDTFREQLNAAFCAKFNMFLVTEFSIFTMSLSSRLDSGGAMTPEQREFISAYSDGYVAAMSQITDRS